MPSAYAHIRFGKQVLESLPESTANIIRSEYSLFSLGLQGPDFLFFYRPYKQPNRIARIGLSIHSRPGYEYFKKAFEALRKRRFAPPYYAYLCGAICHFVLDSRCHPYISAITERYGVGHLELEYTFDRALLAYDGKDSKKCALAEYRADKRQSAVMAAFFPGLSPAEICRSVNSAAFWVGKYCAVRRYAGRYVCSSIFEGEHLRRKKALKKGCIGLMKRSRNSVAAAVRLINDLKDNASGTKALDEAYELSFSGKKCGDN